MPVSYYEQRLLDKDAHPAVNIDEGHPCYRMLRFPFKGKSVFWWTKEQALIMCKRYLTGESWRTGDIHDEFGEDIRKYKFEQIILDSHYVNLSTGTTMFPGSRHIVEGEVSEETIGEMWKAHQEMQEAERLAKEEELKKEEEDIPEDVND